MLKNKALFAVTLIAVLFSYPAPAKGVSYFYFKGRAWGHGIGLSQYGAKGYAEHGYSTNNILSHYYKKTAQGANGNKVVRVHVAGRKSSVSLISNSSFYITDLSANKRYGLTKQNKYKTVKYGTKYKVVNVTTGKTKGTFKGPLYFTPGKSLIKLINSNDNGVSNIKYRGGFKVKLNSSLFTVINRVSLELYLRGVVPYEMPSSWHIVALQVQAIAARSYAYASIKNRGDFDLYSTTKSQVYGGYNAENKRTNIACNRTKGIVRKFNGKVIQAFFFSSSGGRTENNENVWNGTAIPYLRGVNSPYENSNLWKNNPIKFSSSYLKSKLGSYVKGSLVSLKVIKYGYSPRVVKVKITGSGATSYISGSKLRSVLGLKSTWFSISR